MAINIADIITEYGAYYKAQGQNEKSLRAKLFRKNDTAMYFRTIPTNDTVLDFGNFSVNTVVQAFQKAWTPIATLTGKPRRIPLHKLKIDVEEAPDDVELSWIGFLADGGLDRATWPFIRWYIEKYLIPQKEEDIELNECFAGEYVVPTPGTANSAGENMDGIRKKVNDAVTAGDANEIVMGAVPADPEDYCTYIEDFVKQIPAHVRKKLDLIMLSNDNLDKYKEGKTAKYNMNYEMEKSLVTIKNYNNISVVGLDSWGSSEKIITTLPDNRIRGLKKPENGKTFRVESAQRLVSLFTDWFEVYDFIDMGYVYTNDQDNV